MSLAAKVLASTQNMQHHDWLQSRAKGIGGSDAPVILDLSKWKTRFELWLEKTGQTELAETDNEAAYWGTQLEDLVAHEFMNRTGKKVRRRNQILQHPEHDWMLANIDREVIGENAILECKTSSAWFRGEWKNDEVPDAYIVQVQHYMAVTGTQKAYIAVLIGGNQFKWKEIPRDDELIKIIIDAEKQFWEFNVLGNKPPLLDGSSAAEKFVKERYAAAKSGKVAELPNLYSEKIQELLTLKTQISLLEKSQKEIENQLKNELKDAETGLVGHFAINWKSVTQNRFDTKTFQVEHPDLYAEFLKPSVSRRFDVKEIG